jgi:tetratricopeptide (TPR) repeat protein
MNKALLQWAILMSISAIGALVYHEVVKKKLKNKRIDSLKEKNKTSETKLPSTDEEPTSSVLNLGQEEATLATTKYKQGLYEDAIKFYTKAINQSQLPKIIDYKNLKIMFSNRAAAYEKLQDHHNVIKDCTSALELDSRHSKSYLRRAKAKSFLLDFAGALGDYVCMVVICDEKKEQLDPNIASEIDRLHSELTMQAIEDARQNKKSSLRYLPPDFFITSYFSTFHPSDDDSKITVDASVDVYTVEINSLNAPDHSSPQKGLLLVKRALAKNAKQDYEGAAIDFDSSLQYLRPGNEGYYISQLSNGTFHHLRGNFSKAEDCFKHALKENPSSIFAQVRSW